MAAVKNNHSKHNQDTRDKIRTTQLIKRLEDHALGTIELTPTQVQSIKILLSKTLADLSSVAHTDSNGDNLAPMVPQIFINGIEKK